jgi:hypothetical protein
VPESSTRSGSRTTTALLSVTTTLALVAGLVGLATPAQAGAIKAARARYASVIEPLAGYQAQTSCSPSAKPGVADFANRLLRANPTSRSLGIVRACSAGGRSEHKEGRAFDWGVSAHSAADRARVARLMRWLLKKDRFGNRYAMARRLGIQYMIWNRRIWGSYAAGSGWRRYTGASPHTDHVHFSFTWAGARKRTSFWTGKVGRVNAAPPPVSRPKRPPVVTTPRPTLPTPRPTTTRPTTPRPTVPTPRPTTPTIPPPRPVPLPAAFLPGGPALVDETLTVPATSPGVLTTGALQAGQEYLVEVSGTYAYGSGENQLADAECSTTTGTTSWRRDRSIHPAQRGEDHLDLYVDGSDLWADADVDAGNDCDLRTHTYRDTITPTRTGRVTLALWDPTTPDDNSGELTVRILAVTPQAEMDWQLPATAAAGVTSPGALEAGVIYLLTVTGTVDAGGGVSSDAECSATTTDPVWRMNRSVDASAPSADHLDLLLDRRDVTFTPVEDPDDDDCDTGTHIYRRAVRLDTTRPVNLRVDDPAWQDNSGALTVHAERVDPVADAETVAVDASQPAVETSRNYLAGQALLVTVTGTYAYTADVDADAECSATAADPVWRSSRTEVRRDGRYYGDVLVDGRGWWRTAAGTSCDPTSHTYTMAYTPGRTGPLRLGVDDLDLSDNTGTLTVTISPAAG